MSSPANSLRQFPALLQRCAPSLTKTVTASAAVLLAGVGIIAMSTSHKSTDAVVALVMWNLALAVLWGLWFSRLVLLHLQATQARMPVLGQAVIVALGLLAVFTVLLPAWVVSVLGGPFWLAFSSMLATVCGTLLLVLLPRIVSLLLLFLPMLLRLLQAVLNMLPLDFSTFKILGANLQWQWLLPVLLGLVAWRLAAIVRATSHLPSTGWWAPVIVANMQDGGAFKRMSSGDANGHLPDWLWPAGQVEKAGPQRPVRAVRALLGTPFAPLSRQQWLVQIGIAAAFLFMASSNSGGAMHAGHLGGMIGGVLGGMGSLLLMYGQRLAGVYGKSGGELNELALLPGFGAANAQRASLLRALVQAMGGVAGILLLLTLGVARWGGFALTMQGLMLMAFIGMLLLTALACLRPLAGQQLLGWPMLALSFVIVALAVISVLFAAQGNGDGLWPLRIALSWCVAYPVIGLFLGTSWRKFQARPHPFLLP